MPVVNPDPVFSPVAIPYLAIIEVQWSEIKGHEEILANFNSTS
jgi:hypothetical protein